MSKKLQSRVKEILHKFLDYEVANQLFYVFVGRIAADGTPSL